MDARAQVGVGVRKGAGVEPAAGAAVGLGRDGGPEVLEHEQMAAAAAYAAGALEAAETALNAGANIDRAFAYASRAMRKAYRCCWPVPRGTRAEGRSRGGSCRCMWRTEVVTKVAKFCQGAGWCCGKS